MSRYILYEYDNRKLCQDPTLLQCYASDKSNLLGEGEEHPLQNFSDLFVALARNACFCAICLEIHFCFFLQNILSLLVYIHSSLGSAVSPFLHLVCPSGPVATLDRSSPSTKNTAKPTK